MKNNFFKRVIIIGILLLLVGASIIPNITGDIKNNYNDFTDKAPNFKATENKIVQNRDPWDLLAVYNIGATGASGASGNAGAEFDGTYLYSTRWLSNLIHRYNKNGMLVEEFSITGVQQLRDLAFDGTYMYGGNDYGTPGVTPGYIYKMDFTTKTLIGTITGNFKCRAIAYNNDLDVFYVSSWDDPVWVVNRQGQIISQFNLGIATSTYGFAYDSDGPYLWVFDQGNGPGTSQYIRQWDLTAGMMTGVIHDVSADVGSGSGIAGGLWTSVDYASGLFCIGGCLQDGDNPGVTDWLFVYELYPAGSQSNPPNTPNKPSGPTSLNTGQSGTYSTSATDPDGDSVQYRFDWDAAGSHDYSDWTGFVPSGAPGSISQSWSNSGTYVVKAQARDIHGATSGWSTGLTVTVSRQSFNIVHISDLHYGYNGARNNIQTLLNHIKDLSPKPKCVIVSGDILSWGWESPGLPLIAWPWYEEESNSYSKVLNDFNSILVDNGIPVVFSPGNHDSYCFPYGCMGFQKYINQLPGFYYCDTKILDAYILSISSGVDDLIASPTFPPKGTGFSTNDINWIATKLDDLDGIQNGVDLSSFKKIIIMHHPTINYMHGFLPGEDCWFQFPWNKRATWDAGVIHNNRVNFMNIMDQYNVDVICSGHIHRSRDYQRSMDWSDHVYDKDGFSKDYGWYYNDPQEYPLSSANIPLYINQCEAFQGYYRILTVEEDEIIVYKSAFIPGGLDGKSDFVKGLINVKLSSSNLSENLSGCAATLHLYDSFGNHVGRNENGTGNDFEINGSVHIFLPIEFTEEQDPTKWNNTKEEIFMFLGNYDMRYEIVGSHNGSIDLFIERNLPDCPTAYAFYSNVSLTEISKGFFSVNKTYIDYTIYMDDNSDGIIDREIEPTILFSPPFAPNKPIGPIYGITSEYLLFSTNSIDPDNDQIYYLFDWADGTNSSWLGPFDSGEEITAYHKWKYPGEYEIKVRAKDIFGAETEWSESVTVQIVSLKPTIIAGFISDKNETGEFTTFNAKFLGILPSKYYIYYSGEQIIISNDYQGKGRVWPKFVIGVFNATIVSESYSSETHHFHNRLLNLLYHNIKNQ